MQSVLLNKKKWLESLMSLGVKFLKLTSIALDLAIRKLQDWRHAEFVHFEDTFMKHVLSYNILLCVMSAPHSSFLVCASPMAILMHAILMKNQPCMSYGGRDE